MNTLTFNDIINLGKRITDENGFVTVPAVITAVGVQEYSADELEGLEGIDSAMRNSSGLINVFRPPETVFHPLTIDSFRDMPVTILHPARGLSPEDAKYSVVGHISNSVSKMDELRLGTKLHLYDEGAIGTSLGSHTSAGYKCSIERKDGQFNGVAYQYSFDGAMIGNHLALVPAGRCGDGVMVLDSSKENDMKDNEIVDLVTAKVKTEVEDAVKKSVAGLNIGDTIKTALKEHTDALAEEATKQAELAAEKTKLDAEDKLKNDSLVARTVDLKIILGDDFDSAKPQDEMIKLAFGDEYKDVEGKSDEYIDEKLSDKTKEITGARVNANDSFSDSASTGAVAINMQAEF